MFSQINLWTERAGMLLDVVLMLRILQLKLHRTYVFIALFALLSLFYDGVELVLGSQSQTFDRVVLLSRFVYAIVFPLAIWDLFEEARPTVEKLRRLAMSRMISSLLFISVWGLLIAAFTGADNEDQSHYLFRFAFVVWTGSVAAALAFLWIMRRGIKANHWQLPWNAEIWYRFFQVLLVIEAISCVLDIVIPSLKALGSSFSDPIVSASEPVLQVGALIITGWCVFRLRAEPTNKADMTADVKL